MPFELEALSARIVALETVLGHLVTHLAAHADDPARWVSTRKTLALHAVRSAGEDQDSQPHLRSTTDALCGAIAEFFDPVEHALGTEHDGRTADHGPTEPGGRRNSDNC
jgi:hypothetical protein